MVKLTALELCHALEAQVVHTALQDDQFHSLLLKHECSRHEVYFKTLSTLKTNTRIHNVSKLSRGHLHIQIHKSLSPCWLIHVCLSITWYAQQSTTAEKLNFSVRHSKPKVKLSENA
jgi:hypothetical protein